MLQTDPKFVDQSMLQSIKSIYIYTHTVYIYIYMYIYMYVYIYIYIYICMYVCMYVCMCIYIYIHALLEN